MHNGIVTESFGYPELRGVSLSDLRDKTGLPCMAARDMQVVAAGYAAQYTPTPKAVVCIYIGKLGAGAGIVLDGKVWGVPQALPVNYTICRLNTISNTRRITLQARDISEVICGCGAHQSDRVVLYADQMPQICVRRCRSRPCR